MASSGPTCQKCGEKITGQKYTVDGKNYCYSCYQKILDEKEKLEKDKQELYNYIKELFNIREVPSEIISMLDREIAAGKKPKGMKLTLKYYYIIQGNTINYDKLVSLIFVIKDYYESAKKYQKDMAALKEKNLKKNIENKQRIIKINPKDLGNPSRDSKEPKYDINKL